MAGYDEARRRHRLVHDVAKDFAGHGPQALARWGPAIDTEYGGLDAFLRDVQWRYLNTATARLDAVLEAAPADPHEALAAMLAEVAAVLPDLRLLLAEHADHPALAEGEARFRRSVQAATGVQLGDLFPAEPSRTARTCPIGILRRRRRSSVILQGGV